MKRPFCKVCQSHHYSHEPHNFPATDEAPRDEPGVVEKRRVDDAPKSPRKVAVRKLEVRSLTDAQRESLRVSDEELTARVALTAAERQKRFRDKDPEGYRKWNRDRMRKRRAKRDPD